MKSKREVLLKLFISTLYLSAFRRRLCDRDIDEEKVCGRVPLDPGG